MIAAVRLVNASITPYSYLFGVYMVRMFKIYSLSNFHVYNTVLLTTVALLYI